MESDALREQLAAADRGEAATWLAWSGATWWHPLFFAAWVVVFVLNVGLGDDLGSPLVNFALTFAAVAVVMVESRRRGTWPDGGMPRELRPSVTWSLVGFVALAVGGWCATFVLDVWVVAALAGVATYVLMAAYGRAYERAARRVVARLEETR